MKKSEFQEMIREIVKEEIDNVVSEVVNDYISKYIPVMLGEVISETVDRRISKFVANNTPVAKKRPLKESRTLLLDDDIGDTEYRTLGGRPFTSEVARSPMPFANRAKVEEMIGYGDQSPINTIDRIVTDTGVERPIDPNAVPDYLVQALNKDYSGILKKMDEKARNLRPV
jgi:hypothetical protein